MGATNVLIIFALMLMNGLDYYQNFLVWSKSMSKFIMG